MKTSGNTLRSASTHVLLIGLVILTLTGVTHRFLDWAGLRHLRDHNRQYLQSALNQSLSTFAVLSGIKVGLAVLEGSELGMGFGLEVGDAVQSMYDYVDVAWRVILASSAILMGLQFLLLTSQFLEPWFLIITLLLLLAGRFLKWIMKKRHAIRSLRDLAAFMAILTVTLYLLLPLSVWGAGRLSGSITQPALKEATADLNHIRSDFFPESGHGKSGILGKLQETREKLAQISGLLVDKSKETSLLLLKLIAGYLFDTLIFPMLLFLLLFHFTRIVTAYIFDIQRQNAFRQDIDGLLSKYFIPHKDNV
ncbi:hypothetical protein JW948_18330 [bacterium]|nr:hypothetical protein [bacterium]